MAAQHVEECYEKNTFTYFLACKGLANDGGVTRDTAFQEIRPEAGFKKGDFVQEKMRGLP